MKPRQRQAAMSGVSAKGVNARLKNWRNTLTPQAQPFAKIWSFWNMPEPSSFVFYGGGVVLNKVNPDPLIDHKTLINTHKKELIAEAASWFYS